LKVRKVIYYSIFIPTMLVTALLMSSVGLLLPYRWRMECVTLWNIFATKPLLRICDIHIDLSGQENIPSQGPYMVVSNHQSEWETFYLSRLFRPVCMVIKKELLSIPVFGWAMRAARHIPIDRTQSHRSIDQILNGGKARLAEGHNLLIFPEATRMPAGQMKRYSRTAAKLAVEAGVPLLPVVHNAGNCWSNRGLMRPGVIRVCVGEPISTTGKSADDVAQEAEQWSIKTFNDIKG
jgi:1-acyl-sn-glycerol-3-phosphate acyltransferase